MLIVDKLMYCLSITLAFQVPLVTVPSEVISLPFTDISCVEPSAAVFVIEIPVPADTDST